MKKTLLVFTAIVLLAAGCGKKAAMQPQNSGDNGQATSGQSSFKDFLASGKSQVCDVTFNSGNVSTSGELYVASGKLRGEFTAQVQGKTVESYMIVKDQTVYTWVEGLGTTAAFKTSLNTSSGNASTTQTRSTDVNQKVSYNCKSWTEDDSEFELPAGVTFQSTAAITPNGAAGNSGAQGSAQQCAACSSAGANKAQCLAALHCN